MTQANLGEDISHLDKGDVIFLDVYNLMYRAYHGTEPLSASDGTPTNAVYTMLRILLAIEKTHGKDNMRFGFAVFDGGGDNFRKEISEVYKEGRKEMPEDLKIQIPYIKQLLEILGWKVVQPVGVEADDWIATMATRSSRKLMTYVYSSDKDFYALVSSSLKVVDGKAKLIYGREEVFEKLGVYPENVVGYLALMGDDVDNIIGIDKCGKKTAAKWLNEYGNIDNLIANAENIKGIVGNNLRESIASGQLATNLKLVQMRLDLDVTVSVKECRKEYIKQKELEDFCRALDFKSFLPENRAQYQAQAASSQRRKP